MRVPKSCQDASSGVASPEHDTGTPGNVAEISGLALRSEGGV